MAEVPQLNLCKICGNNEYIEIPPEIKAQYMNDPIRAPEWRQLVLAFENSWGKLAERQEVEESEKVVDEQAGEESGKSVWETAFLDEPATKAEFESRYKALHSFPINDTLAGVIVEGPKLFIQGLGDGEWPTSDPILTYGAGSWLLDSKAESYLRDRLSLFLSCNCL